MKTIYAVAAVLAAFLTIALLVPLEAEAGGHGGGRGVGMRSFHFGGHRQAFGFRHRLAFGFRQHRGFGFGLWPYGYYALAPDTDDYLTYPPPQIVVREPAPPTVPPCQPSERTYTVPSANGETRQVTINRHC